MVPALVRSLLWLSCAWLVACGGSSSGARGPAAKGAYGGADSPAAMEVQVSGDSDGDAVLDEQDVGGQPAPAPEPSLGSTAGAEFRATGTKKEDAPMRPADLRSEATGSAGPQKLAQNVPSPGGSPGQPPVTTPKPPSKDKRGETRSDVAVQQSPMLIYTAQLTMAVFEVKKSIGEVEELGRELGGFLARRTDHAITIRVPAARFDEAIKRLERVGDMLNRNVTAEDVTEEFSDLEVRLKSARAVRDRLEQLLAKATKVEESVLIERELERVAGEIERVEGRLKFLKDRATYSTITVTFQARRTEVVGSDRFNLPVPWLYELGLRRLLTL